MSLFTLLWIARLEGLFDFHLLFCLLRAIIELLTLAHNRVHYARVSLGIDQDWPASFRVCAEFGVNARLEAGPHIIEFLDSVLQVLVLRVLFGLH